MGTTEPRKGIVNLSLKIEDIQEFIDGFKKMGETVSAVTTEVSKGMTDISQYLRQCTEGFNALSKSLTDITNNMSKFSFDNLKNQIDDFTVFAESLAKATSGTSNLQQQTAQFAQTFGSADLARQGDSAGNSGPTDPTAIFNSNKRTQTVF